MTIVNTTPASTVLQEKRKAYQKFSGEGLKHKLIPKYDKMKCVKEDEIHLKETRILQVDNGVVMDVTDEQNPRTVPADEVYLIGWA